MSWRPTLNQILYTLQFRVLDEQSLTFVESSITNRRGLTEGAAEYADAIRAALAQGEPLDTQIGTPHGDEELRAFFTQLLDRLAHDGRRGVVPAAGRAEAVPCAGYPPVCTWPSAPPAWRASPWSASRPRWMMMESMRGSCPPAASPNP